MILFFGLIYLIYSFLSPFKCQWKSGQHNETSYQIDGFEERQTDACYLKCTSCEAEQTSDTKYPSADSLVLVTLNEKNTTTTTRRFGIVISARISKRDEKKLHHMQIKLKTLPLTKNIKYVGVTPVASLSYLFKQWTAVLGKIKCFICAVF